MTLKVYIKSIYGRDTIYPKCEASKAFVKALGQKTFTQGLIDAAKALGASFDVVAEREVSI